MRRRMKAKSVFKTVRNLVGIAITAIFLIVGGVSVIESVSGFSKSNLIGVNFYLVVSESMSCVNDANKERLQGTRAGFLQINDVIVTTKIFKNTDVEVGDIVTFETEDGITVVHRVIEIYNDGNQTYYKTQGDANDAVDPFKLTKDDLKEKFFFSIPKVGLFLVFIKSKYGVLFLLFVVLVLFASAYFDISEKEKNDPLFCAREEATVKRSDFTKRRSR